MPHGGRGQQQPAPQGQQTAQQPAGGQAPAGGQGMPPAAMQEMMSNDPASIADIGGGMEEEMGLAQELTALAGMAGINPDVANAVLDMPQEDLIAEVQNMFDRLTGGSQDGGDSESA